jgi:predicted glycoside hydrolase/deacetylase ChbG (UPF0249 family)
MTRTIILCADDFALTPGISRSIVDLALRGRLSAISCMTCMPHWAEHAVWLKPLIGKIDIGLHLTLVDEAPITGMPHTAPNGKLPSISTLIVRSYLGLLDLDEIEVETAAQFSAFERALGIPPSHVDGHLHTHVLPGIRDIVLRRAAQCTPKPWVRNVYDPLSQILRRGIARPKALILNTLGKALAQDVSWHQRMNDGFSGLYGLGGHEAYADYFQKFVASDAQRHVVMCHPGAMALENVACASARAKETTFFSSDDFPAVLSRLDLRLGRFDEANNSHSAR